MIELESDDDNSVESGSCTCSDYNSDYSWFYDSRKLETSYMRFSILNDNYLISNKQENSRNISGEKKLSKNNKINEFKKNLNENYSNKRKNIIKLSSSSSDKKIEDTKEDKSNKAKLSDNNFTKNSIDKKEKDKIEENQNNQNSEQEINLSNHYESKTFKDINVGQKTPNFFPENVNDYEHNYSASIEKLNFTDANINLHKSPINTTNKRRNIFKKKDNLQKTEEKRYRRRFNFNSPKKNSPKRNLFRRFMRTNRLNENNEQDNNIDDNEKISENANVINKNFQTKERTIKEKIVKETKTITLEPGQTIKPKNITKRILKPNTTVVKNEDGTENIIVENTVLTTVTVNEIVDSSELIQDKYPLDVQLVKQYITKIYKTEIENRPYNHKKEF